MWYASDLMDHGICLVVDQKWSAIQQQFLATNSVIPVNSCLTACTSMLPKIRKCPTVSMLLMRKRQHWQQYILNELHDISRLMLFQLKAFPAEVLRLHLSSCNLVTTNSITAMVSWLHSELQHQTLVHQTWLLILRHRHSYNSPWKTLWTKA